MFMIIFFSMIIQIIFTIIYFIKSMCKNCMKKIIKDDTSENLTVISNETNNTGNTLISMETRFSNIV